MSKEKQNRLFALADSLDRLLDMKALPTVRGEMIEEMQNLLMELGYTSQRGLLIDRIIYLVNEQLVKNQDAAKEEGFDIITVGRRTLFGVHRVNPVDTLAFIVREAFDLEGGYRSKNFQQWFTVTEEHLLQTLCGLRFWSEDGGDGETIVLYAGTPNGQIRLAVLDK